MPSRGRSEDRSRRRVGLRAGAVILAKTVTTEMGGAFPGEELMVCITLPWGKPDSNSRSHVERIAVFPSGRAVLPAPPARRGTNPKRDGRFESGFFQR